MYRTKRIMILSFAVVGLSFLGFTWWLNKQLRPPESVEILNKLKPKLESSRIWREWISHRDDVNDVHWNFATNKKQLLIELGTSEPVDTDVQDKLRDILGEQIEITFIHATE